MKWRTQEAQIFYTGCSSAAYRSGTRSWQCSHRLSLSFAAQVKVDPPISHIIPPSIDVFTERSTQVVVNPPAVSQNSKTAIIPVAASGCDGQTGRVIFEDKFTDDAGGWYFGEDSGLLFKAPGATILVSASDGNRSVSAHKSVSAHNMTFSAIQGDFCAEMSFPAEAVQLDAVIGVQFLAADYLNEWLAQAFASGKVGLYTLADNKWSEVWLEETKNLVKTGPEDVNSLRAVIKNGEITIIVNGQTLKTRRAPIPSAARKFGVYAGYSKPSATPVSFPVRSYKVTAVD